MRIAFQWLKWFCFSFNFINIFLSKSLFTRVHLRSSLVRSIYFDKIRYTILYLVGLITKLVHCLWEIDSNLQVIYIYMYKSIYRSISLQCDLLVYIANNDGIKSLIFKCPKLWKPRFFNCHSNFRHFMIYVKDYARWLANIEKRTLSNWTESV